MKKDYLGLTKEQLMQKLDKLPDGCIVAILDGFNGGGWARAINLGPVIRDCKEEVEDEENIPPGTPVAIMGFGCY